MDTQNSSAPADTQEAVNLYDVFATDPQAETEGKWVPFANSRFRIRSASSKAYQQVRTKQLRAQAPLLRANGGVLPPDEVTAAEVGLACTAIVGWENVPVPPWWDAKKYAGPLLPYSAANAKALMADPRLHRLRSSILNAAESYDTFRSAETAALEGNSASASGGNSNTVNEPTA